MNIYHPELQSVQAVVFDLDGTLYNKRKFVLRVMGALLSTIFILAHERIVRRRLTGKYFGSREAFREAFFHGNHRFMRWYDEVYMPAQVKILQKHYHSLDWAREVITELHRRGAKVVVLSDYDAAPEKLQALGYSLRDFDWVVSSSELGGLKPSKETMEKVLAHLNVPANRCLVIGDRDKKDGELARSVGAHFLLVKN